MKKKGFSLKSRLQRYEKSIKNRGSILVKFFNKYLSLSKYILFWDSGVKLDRNEALAQLSLFLCPKPEAEEY